VSRHSETEVISHPTTFERINAAVGAWVSVDTVTRARQELEMGLTVRHGRRGRVLARWVLRCADVRDFGLSDFDGGGLRLYSGSHPVVKQHTDRRATLRVSVAVDPDRVIGVPLRAHVVAVDDWIPFDRYCGPTTWKGSRLAVRGPAFLLRRYAVALRRAGVKAVLALRSKARPSSLRAIHFGASYVVARKFIAVEVD
jgi:hypothetical protein